MSKKQGTVPFARGRVASATFLIDILRTTGQYRQRYNGRPYPESKLDAIAQMLSVVDSDDAMIDSMRSELEALEAEMKLETDWLDFMQHG